MLFNREKLRNELMEGKIRSFTFVTKEDGVYKEYLYKIFGFKRIRCIFFENGKKYFTDEIHDIHAIKGELDGYSYINNCGNGIEDGILQVEYHDTGETVKHNSINARRPQTPDVTVDIKFLD